MSDTNKKNKDKKKQDERSKVSLFKVLKYGFKITMQSTPIFFVMFNIVGIVHGVSNGFSTFVMQGFYDSVAGVITNREPTSHAHMMIIAMGLTMIAREVLNGVHHFMLSVMNGKLYGAVKRIIHKKMARIAPVCLEDTKLHNDIEKASTGAETVLDITNMAFTIFSFYVPYFFFMGFYLNHLKPQFTVAIVLVFIPVLLSQFIRTGIVSKFEDKAAPVRREFNYYGRAIIDREYYKETRMLGAYGFFRERFMTVMKKLSKEEWKANKRINLIEFGMSLMSAGGYAGILYMLVTALLAGEISVGAFAAVFTSIGMMFELMNLMIKSHIGRMAADLGKAHNFVRFMELPERGGAEFTPAFEQGIVAENVSFTYPHAEHKSVDGVTLEIKAGETVAIVGENGAGKTTLVRLLMGLFAPSEGKVTLNGMDTAQASSDSVFSGISGVFQKYQRYQMTLEENIHISDADSSAETSSVIEQAGVDIAGASFPDGMATMLSREFDGVDLSGGEWQRVAIARGLYRIHNVVVLDEPTASIDPIEESRIYNKFIEISKDKTAIIVTHRLGSTKIADRVVVMDKGKIVNIGTHYELLQAGGLYADMYVAQAGWYEKEKAATT